MNKLSRITALFTAALMLVSSPAAAFARSAQPYAAEEVQSDVIEISSMEDLKQLSEKCVLDSYSMGKTFVLTCDLNTAGTGFKPIPSFSGTFDGNGHKISGLNISEKTSAAGLFRYIEQRGTVQNLTVEGLVSPAGTAAKCGGIAGVNRGRIMYCTFNGFVCGKEQCGGIVGVNEETGMIGKCVSYGRVEANHCAGGIAGENYGSLRCCENNAEINTNATESTLELSDITASDLYAAEHITDIMDEGGIAGYSSGNIQRCVNRGTIGYPHVGYNVGGIVGRHSGYVSGCENYGTVYGRKDSGGIVGQAEPHLMISYQQEKADELRNALDELNLLIDSAIDHANGNTDLVSEGFDQINDTLGDMRDKGDLMLDEAERIINTDVDEINELSARISDAIDLLRPVTDTLSDSAGLVSDAFDKLSDAGVLLGSAGEDLDKGLEIIFDSLEDFSAAVTELQGSSDAISTALDKLQAGLGDPDRMEEAIEALREDIHIAKFAVKSISSNSSELLSAFSRFKNDPTLKSASESVEEALRDISETSDKLSEDLDRMSSVLDRISAKLEPILEKAENGGYTPEAPDTPDVSDTPDIPEVPEIPDSEAGEGGFGETIGDIIGGIPGLPVETAETAETAGTGEAEDILSGIIGGISEEDRNSLEEDLGGIGDYDELDGYLDFLRDIAEAVDAEDIEELFDCAVSTSEDIAELFGAFSDFSEGVTDIVTSEAADRLGSDLDRITEDIRNDMNYISVYTDTDVVESDLDLNELNEAVNYLKQAADGITASGDSIKDAIAVVERSWKYLDYASQAAAAAAYCVSDASDIAGAASDRLAAAVDEVGDILDYFGEKREISFVGADDGFIDSRDRLFDTLEDFTEALSRLNDYADRLGDDFADDLRAINDQCAVIEDILFDIVDEIKDASLNPKEHTEDISSEDGQGASDGKTANCINYGEINADVNVGGIVGAMGIENPDDPESVTAETIGELSLNFMYLLKGVVRGCDNYGKVTAKKDGAGGIIGEMSLGTVINCGGFGDVSSTGGGYVGGVVGEAEGSITDCWSMCRVSGGSCVGGIAGAAKDMSGCRAFTQITKADEFCGSIAGKADGELSGNVFVENGTGGVDGISYRSKAFSVTYEKMLTLSGVPDEFSVMKLIFMADEQPVAVLEYGYGDSVPEKDIPAVPEKEGCYAKWEDFEREELHYGAIINAEYYSLITAIASEACREDGLAVLLAEGVFGDDAVLTAEGSGSVWKVAITADGTENRVFRYYSEEKPEKTDVLINGERVSSTADGRYIVFETALTEFELTTAPKPTDPTPFVVGGCSAAILVLLIAVVRIRKKKKARINTEDEVKQ